MSQNTSQLQRLHVLRRYPEVLGWIEKTVSAVASKDIDPVSAIGTTFAANVVVAADYPAETIALHDGWAVASEQITDASAYAPALPAKRPPWVNVGQQIPRDADAVLAADALAETDNRIEVYAPVTSGDGIVQAGGEAPKGELLFEAGDLVRPVDAAILHALGFTSVSVRVPKIKIIPLSVASAESDFISPVISKAISANGADCEVLYGTELEQLASRTDFDAAITVGRTGSGNNDNGVKSLARIGELAFHGIGLAPGQSAAFGSIKRRPLLMLPGRLDAAMSVFLAVGRELIDRLAGAKASQTGAMLPLTKKVTSTIGLAEVVFVRRVADGIAPLGSGVFSLHSLARADGWILIPEASEGLPAGASIEMRKLR